MLARRAYAEDARRRFLAELAQPRAADQAGKGRPSLVLRHDAE
ncbi:hypothetical protein ACYJW8_12655 [Frateuria aurantia]